MTAMLHPRTLLTTIATVATIAVVSGVGCNPPPSNMPAGPLASASADQSKAVGPGIAGSVIVSTTKKPPIGGVVYLEDAPKEPGVAMSASIDIFHKEFTPFITVITTGGMVTFGNKEALPHHVFSPDVKDWDTGFLRKNETAGRLFYEAGTVALLCNVHPEMVGYLVVIPSSHFGKLSADGKYTIENVHPGTYKVTAWAPRMPTVTQSVTVGTTERVTADFELRPAAN